MDKDRIPFTYTMIAPGVYEARPEQALPAGEYGFLYSASTGGGVISMSRQLGLVLGVSILVSLLGGGPSSGTFTTAWLVVAAVSVLASASAYAVASKRAMAAGDTSVRTREAGPKATPGTTGVPRRSAAELVTMATSEPAPPLDSQHIRA